MARGKLRIRQRGSRQQWAQARTFKEFGAIDEAGDGAVAAAGDPPKPLGGDEVVATTRCGLCNLVVEQRRRQGGAVALIAYSLCISCDELRCQGCWSSEDDACAEGGEHEFLEVHYADGGVARTADFGSFRAP